MALEIILVLICSSCSLGRNGPSQAEPLDKCIQVMASGEGTAFSLCGACGDGWTEVALGKLQVLQ